MAIMKPFARFMINSAYLLQGSARYQKTKKFFYNLLENNSYKYKKYFDLMMIVLIFSSVIILIRDVKYTMHDSLEFFNDYIISLIFLVEYMLRVWVYSDNSKLIIKRYEHDELLQRDFDIIDVLKEIVVLKYAYISSLSAIIDVLAIMPFFHELRLLRIFILFRVFKLFRYTKSLRHLLSVLTHKKFELLTLLMFAAIVVFVSGILIYIMEANNPESPIDTLFEAFYWSVVTISTVGYGDFVPKTEAGQVVAMFIIVSGIAVLSFSTSIVVSAFTERMDDIVENKLIEDISSLKQFYLICDYTQTAQQVASKLRRNGKNVVVLDRDEQKIKLAKSHRVQALLGDPGALSSYSKLGIDLKTQVIAVLCMAYDDVSNVYAALTIRSMNKEVKILSLLIDQKNKKKLSLAGVNQIVYAQELVGLIAKEFSGMPVAFEAIHALRSEQSDVITDEILVNTHVSSWCKSVKDLNVGRYRIILMGISPFDGSVFKFNPGEDTALSSGDILLVIGTNVLIDEFKSDLHTKNRS
jgi:voltage-gated potassium channel